MAHKVKALQQWCKLRCDGYKDVEITNMTSSWKSGLAFCAIIHRYRPDLIDYDSLKKEDTFGNSKLAFDVALRELGIAALLDAEDMVVMTVPDKLCIVTYVAQYYNYFHDKPQMGGPGVKSAVKRPLAEQKKETSAKNPTITTEVEKKISPATKRRTIEDRCCMCHEKVYLLERHYSSGKLYHRHCCREAERSSTLKQNKKLNAGTENTGYCFKENQLSKPASNKAGSIFDYRTVSDPKETVDKQPSKPTSAGLKKSLFVPVKYNPEIYEAKQESDNISTILGSKFSSSYCEPEIENRSLHLKPVQGKTDAVLPSGSFPGVVSNVKSSTALPVTTSVCGVPTISTYTHSSVTNKVSAPVMGKAAYNFTIVNNVSGTSILQSTNKNSDKVVSSGLTAAKSCSNSSCSPVIASNAKASKYVSTVVASSTASTTSTMTSSALPSCHLGYGNTKTSGKVPSSASHYGNYTGGSLLDSDRLSLLSSDQKMMKVKTIGVKDNSTNKPEWQLEAERRQAARNGVYLDPEIHPRSASGQRFENKLMHVDQLQKKECDEIKGDLNEQSILNSGNSQNNAKENLTRLLKKQLNPKKDLSEMHFAVDAGLSKPPVQEDYEGKDNDWVIVKQPSEIARQEMLFDPSPRIAEHDLPAEEMSPLSPPERFRQMVGEGAIGFSNSDRIAELAPSIFQRHPSSYPKNMHKKAENPLIPKRRVNAEERVSIDKINKKLISLDEQLRVIETKGRGLEDKIRGGTDEAMDEDEDEVMIDWFKLVKLKYELVREESDLMYRRRQQELEELHEELEYQYRCLISKPDDLKTIDEKKYEEDLLKEIVETVKQRDSIVDSIEVDRQRYLEEDKKICNMMLATGIGSSGKEKKRKKHKKKTRAPAEKGVQRNLSFWKNSKKASDIKE